MSSSKVNTLDNPQFTDQHKDLEDKGKNKKKKKDAKKDPNDPQPVNFFKLFRFSDKLDLFLIFWGFVGGITTGLSSPANTLIFGDLTNAFVEFGNNTIMTGGNVTDEMVEDFLDAIKDFAVYNSIIGAVLLTVSYISVTMFNIAAHRQILRIRDLYLKSALHQDVGWYDLNSTGDFASRMAEDLTKLEDGIGEKVVLYIHFIGTFLGCIILALIKGWQLALICLISLPVTAISMIVIAILSGKLSKNELEAYGKAGAIAEEVLSSIRTVMAFGGHQKELKRYEENLVEAKVNNIRRNMFSGIGFGLLWFLIYASYALAFWYGVGLVFDDMKKPKEDQVYTAGVMTTVFFSVMMGSMNLGMSSTYLEVFSSARAAGAKVYSVIDRKSPIDPSSTGGKKPDSMKGNIQFKNVEFHYPSRKDVPILQKINLDIKKGETVALVGSSGCGKSTCIQLIQRFYDAIEGQVFIDGIDIKELNVRWMRSHIGVVGQEPILFATTIAENIRYGFESATMDEIISAAKMANAHDFISKLPKGYDTIVGERGAQMSGGQKQRVAIARALIRNPDILLLDEATSALDNASEAKVQKALDEASKGRTTIIVAHRLSTIRHADKIFVLEKGAVVETGMHEELMTLKNHYYRLVTAQMAVIDEEETNDGDAGVSKTLQRQLSHQLSIKSASSASTEIEEDEELLQVDEEYLDDFDSKPIPSAPLMKVIKLSNPEWKVIAVGTVASIAMGCGTPIFSIIFGDVMGVFQQEESVARKHANTYSLYFLLVGIVMGIATFFQIYMYGIAGEILTMRMRGRAFSSMLRQETAWFDIKSNSVGALCARLSGDASSVQGATGQRIGTVVQSIATLGLALGLSLSYEWRLGLVSLAFAPLIFIGTILMMRVVRGSSYGTQQALEKSTKIAVEAVGNIRTVAGLGREDKFHEQYMQELEPVHKLAMRNSHVSAIIIGFSRSIVFFAYATAMYYGGQLVANKEVDYPTILKVSQALIMGTFSIANSIAFAPNFQKGLTSAAKMFQLFEREPKIQDPANQRRDSKWNSMGSVNYDRVQFRYPSRPETKVLKGLTLEVLEGKTVALVGQSGCGKSTLVQLLERFYDAESGDVMLDRENIKNLTLKGLRSQLGIVSQEPILFDRTIAENIAYGDNTREVPMDEVIAAAKKANIHDFIASLPMGYETRLGEKGAQLSGGQKQRVAIARALVRNPRVLLLDEATSALDTESERVVQEALDVARQGRTCLTIAHRLSTIQDADLICVINQGRVAELGKHNELIAKRGLYYQLYQLQGGAKIK